MFLIRILALRNFALINCMEMSNPITGMEARAGLSIRLAITGKSVIRLRHSLKHSERTVSGAG